MTVLSLVELCTLSIRNGVEDGTLRLLHERLPLEIRQCIFNAIAMHTTFDNPNCIELIARTEFLEGFATFDTKLGTISTTSISPTSDLFDRIIPIFATVKNGEFFGSNITDLRVPIYYATWGSDESWGTTLPTIIRLVAECRKLRKLVLRLKDFEENVQPSFTEEEHRSFDMLVHSGSNLMNISDSTLPWVPVMQNLEKLAIFGEVVILVLKSDTPIIPFTRLSSLHLYTCRVDGPAWRNFLRMVQPTLRKLHLDDISPENVESPIGIDIFPLPMPVLEKLTIRAQNTLNESVSRMAHCPRLTCVHLDMDEDGVMQSDSQTITRLARISKLALDFHLLQDEFCVAFGLGPNQSRFISTLGSRINKVKLISERDTWSPSHTVALARMINMCSGLTSFEFVDRYQEHPNPVESARAEFEAAKQHLVRLFSDKVRTSKLVSLFLVGDLDDNTLKLISANCTNLKRLRFEMCPHLSDQHFLTMARRGVVLSKLHISECPNIRAEGLLALITKSGSMLEQFYWDNDDNEQRESIEIVLMRNCKYVKGEFKLDHVKQLASTHCFSIGTDCFWDETDVEEDF